MGLHELMCWQWHFMLVAVLFSAIAPPTAAQAKPGCPDRCGNVSIPYPFGVGEGCNLNPDFLITCNYSYNPPKSFLQKSSFEVTEISIDGQLNILRPVARDCYGLNRSLDQHWYTLLNLEKFSVSRSKNKLTVVGCDSFAYLRGLGSITNNKTYLRGAGCMSACELSEYVDEQSCSGTGCCQVEIPDGLLRISVAAFSFNNYTFVSDFSPCTYAFIVDESKYKFSREHLKNIPMDAMFPVVVDWSVDEKNTSIARACSDLATSYKPANVLGFRCRCKEGYEGNPYIGCHDIDECKNKTSNNCAHGCINLDGHYTCSCPKWYRGDGRKDGGGCALYIFPIILIISSCSTGLGIPSLVAIVWWLHKVVKRRRAKKLKEEFFKRNGGLLLEQVSSDDGAKMATNIFTSKELERATDNYNENRILGRGGQGTVYKGMLKDGKIVAIKKSKLIDESQLDQFINELVVLQQINHRNVVKLLGCCLETEVPMLVYEFIPNGMLSYHLYDQNEELSMTWDMRLRIAVEVADALSYLHSEASNPIYHCDIKSANILLDDKYRAKVADFGISRSIDLDQTHLTTPNVQGTLGYLDPEYFRSSQFTDKSDVYSFGVVLVELITGQKPISFARPKDERSLANLFLLALEDDRLFEIVDIRLVNEAPQLAIAAIAELAKRCLNMTGKKRPTMREVVVELQGIRGSEGNFINKQCEKDDAVKYESSGDWEIASFSTMAYMGSGPNLSSDIKPLIFNSL